MENHSSRSGSTHLSCDTILLHTRFSAVDCRFFRLFRVRPLVEFARAMCRNSISQPTGSEEREARSRKQQFATWHAMQFSGNALKHTHAHLDTDTLRMPRYISRPCAWACGCDRLAACCLLLRCILASITPKMSH